MMGLLGISVRFVEVVVKTLVVLLYLGRPSQGLVSYTHGHEGDCSIMRNACF